jgi:ParB-like chromosome segregation protein Spo0J
MNHPLSLGRLLASDTAGAGERRVRKENTLSKPPKVHPYADLFPMMTDEELEALVADIQENGLQQPILRYQGLILDGRNRLLACEKANVEPAFIDHEGDDASAFARVISLNVQRRDLTAGQRAIVAARALQKIPERRGGSRNGKAHGSCALPSRRTVAQKFKVGEQAVQQAKCLVDHAPDLAALVASRSLSLANAYEQHQERVKEAETVERQRGIAAKYHEAIDAGEMTIQEALMKVQEDREQAKYDAQARQLWFGELAGIVKWAKTFGERPDDFLRWYTEGDAKGTEHETTIEDLDYVIEKIQRIKTIIFGAEHKA